MILEKGTELRIKTGNDPATKRVVGHRRFYVAADIGFQDPTGIVLIKDERLPMFDGTKQVLGPRTRVIVFADMFKEVEYSDIADYLQELLTRPAIKGKVSLSIDASGVGAPFSSFLRKRKVKHMSVKITAGDATKRRGDDHHVSKGILIGELANAIEQGDLLIADDLPLKDRIMRELEAFEVKVTPAGNQILSITRSSNVGHGDLAIASSIGLYHSNQAWLGPAEGQLEGYWY